MSVSNKESKSSAGTCLIENQAAKRQKLEGGILRKVCVIVVTIIIINTNLLLFILLFTYILFYRLLLFYCSYEPHVIF